MNIKLLFLISSTLCVSSIMAQNFDTKTLEVNNLKIALQSNGDLHRNSDLTSSISEFPIGSGTNCIYAQSMWLAGYDQNNDLRLAANEYRQSGNDFFYGPVADNYDANYDNTYDHVWHLTRNEIELHMANYNTPGYIVPDEIAHWPANGNTANGEAQNLAPYADLNNNNTYEPELGEHPEIRGEEALYVIYNDDRTVHTESGGEKIGVEIHLMLYAYANNGENHIDNVIYSHYEIYNRSSENSFSSFYISSWLDLDIGYGTDDYIGTNTLQQMVYGYNGGPSDNMYGSNPPAYGFMLLNEPLSHSMYYNNSTDFVSGNPVAPSDYYNYMISQWKDASYLINPMDSTAINYVFPGDSDTLNYANWSEVNSGNIPSDRRILGTTFMQNFGPGNKVCLDYANIFARDTSLNNIEQIDHLFEISEDVQDFYYNQYDDCSDLSDLSVYEFTEGNNTLSLHQNANVISVKTKSSLNSDLHIQVIDVFGRIITQTSLKQGDYEVDVELPKVNTGVYFVKCTNKEINQSIKTIIN